MTNFVIPSNGGTLPSTFQTGNLPAEIDIVIEVDDGRLGKLSWVSGETKRIALVCFKEKNGQQVLRLLKQKEFRNLVRRQAFGSANRETALSPHNANSFMAKRARELVLFGWNMKRTLTVIFSRMPTIL